MHSIIICHLASYLSFSLPIHLTIVTFNLDFIKFIPNSTSPIQGVFFSQPQLQLPPITTIVISFIPQIRFQYCPIDHPRLLKPKYPSQTILKMEQCPHVNPHWEFHHVLSIFNQGYYSKVSAK